SLDPLLQQHILDAFISSYSHRHIERFNTEQWGTQAIELLQSIVSLRGNLTASSPSPSPSPSPSSCTPPVISIIISLNNAFLHVFLVSLLSLSKHNYPKHCIEINGLFPPSFSPPSTPPPPPSISLSSFSFHSMQFSPLTSQ